jgi:hypothetical protein
MESGDWMTVWDSPHGDAAKRTLDGHVDGETPSLFRFRRKA